MTDNSHNEFFHRYARHYASMEGRERIPADFDRLRRDRLPPWLGEIPSDSLLLDAGCAQGHLLETLWRVGYRRLEGIEISATLLQTARKRLAHEVRLTQADLLAWLPKAPADTYAAVFFHDVLEHLPREHTVSVLAEFHRIMAAGGRLSLRLPNMANLTGGFNSAIDFTHVTHFTEFSLIQVLELAGFEPEQVTFESQAPRLFWSTRKPQWAAARLLSRARWRLNRLVHQGLYVLTDFRPMPTVLEPNLVVTAHK